ncbi:cyclase family protein [Methanosphaerula subterraneus]|uniref:cyclase family protein n=1 Tax=Methanosphaerula subterraneus TaxID=3350244 RepID=UPI003F858602
MTIEPSRLVKPGRGRAVVNLRVVIPTVIAVLAVLAAVLLAAALVGEREQTLDQAWQTLKTREYVDLTHTFNQEIPHWPGFPAENRTTLFDYRPGNGTLGSGFFTQSYTHVGQWGTHVDAPSHFVEGLRSVDQIDLHEMVLPLVVLDVHEQVARDPDYTVTLEDVRAWEGRHGPVPAGSFVALRTDWSKRWPDAARMENWRADGIDHYPGWSREVLAYLYEERGIAASGHETSDTDPGTSTSRDDYALETYVLSTDHYQVEFLTNLDQVPETGALVVVGVPKPEGGSGFPARVFAILP